MSSLKAGADFFVLRTPAFSSDEFVEWVSGLDTSNLPVDSLIDSAKAAYDTDWAMQATKLRRHVCDPRFREALLLASPTLDAELDGWLGGPDNEANRRVTLAVAKYFARSRTRATPFGLFSACSIGRIGAAGTTTFDLGCAKPLRRHTRFDSDFLVRLANALIVEPTIREAARFRRNPTAHAVGSEIHYVEAKPAGKVYRYELSVAETSQPLERMLTFAETPSTVQELVGPLVELGIGPVEAREFIEQLIDAQILLSDINPPLDSPDPTSHMISALRGSTRGDAVATCLANGAQMLAAIDEGRRLGSKADYVEVAEALSDLPVKTGPIEMVQVDAFRETDSLVLGRDVLEEFRRGAEILFQLTPRVDPFREFREAFVRRYEAEEIPLLEALDEEKGIGFPTGLEADVLANTQAISSLGSLVARGARSIEHEVSLGPADLERLIVKEVREAPDSLCVVGVVAAASASALRVGEFRVLVGGVSGPSGVPFLGRFCHLDDQLQHHVERHLRVEETMMDGVFAEVYHLPGDRVGNVVFRPPLRQHGIAILGTVSTHTDVVPLSDLMVTVRDGHVIVRSASRNRRIVPRITTAQNTSSPGHLPLFRFLALLQREGLHSDAYWTWGRLEGAEFLPRVSSGRVVLRCAEWNLKPKDLGTPPRTPFDRFKVFRDWHRSGSLPKQLMIKQNDVNLTVDVDSPISVEVCWQMLKRNGSLRLLEQWPALDQQAVAGDEGRFVGHFVIPFVRSDKQPVAQTRLMRQEVGVRRRFSPISEWVYVKVFCGPTVARAVLREVLRPIIVELSDAGVLSQWFFLYYPDPAPHIRVRFNGIASVLRAELVPRLETAFTELLGDRLVGSVQYDTYIREVERYGGPRGVLIAESAFHADSEAAINLLDEFDEPTWLSSRRFIGIRSAYALTRSLGWSDEGLARIYRELDATDKDARQRYADEFRSQRVELEAAIADVESGESAAPEIPILGQRNSLIRQLQSEWRMAATGTFMTVTKGLIHMNVNRLGLAEDERRLYSWLRRLAESRVARNHN